MIWIDGVIGEVSNCFWHNYANENTLLVNTQDSKLKLQVTQTFRREDQVSGLRLFCTICLVFLKLSCLNCWYLHLISLTSRLKNISSQECMDLKLVWNWKLFTQWSHQSFVQQQSPRAWVPTTLQSPPTTKKMCHQSLFVAIVTLQAFSQQDGVPGIKLICLFLQVRLLIWNVTTVVISWIVFIILIFDLIDT